MKKDIVMNGKGKLMSDLIERQAAIRKLKKMATQAYIDKLNGSAETVINCCIDVIERQIPSAQPEPCKDAVSRADVVDMLEMFPFTEYSEYETAREVVKRLPSAKPESEERKAESAQNVPIEDLISRKAAIDAIVDCTVYGNADELEEAVMQGNDWNRWSGGVLEALESVKELPSVTPKCPECDDAVSREAAIDVAENAFVRGLLASPDIRKLPSVQPEIVRCGQCKYAEVADAQDNQDGYTCQFHRGSIWFSGSYCSWGERRTDAED